MEFKCYVKNCDERSDHQLAVDDATVMVCGKHYDDTSAIFNDCQDTILNAKRDARKKVRHLGVRSGG